MMEFSPDLPINQALNQKLAGAYLGIDPRNLKRLQNAGKIEAFLVMTGRRKLWRYPMESLHRYRQEHKPNKSLWDPHEGELPPKVVARLIGVSVTAVKLLKCKRSLKSYAPDDVRAYILKKYSRQVSQAIRYPLLKKIYALQSGNRSMARKLSHMLCTGCERNTIRQNSPVALTQKIKCPKKPEMTFEA